MAKVAKTEGFTFRGASFTGDAPLVAGLLGGHVMVAGLGIMAARSHIEAKTMRVLLLFGTERLDYAPDALTFYNTL